MAGLGALLDDEWSAALRAWLVERLVRRSVIAIGITAAAVEYSAASAPFGCTAADKFAFVALRALDTKRDGARVFAFGIIFTTDEIAEAALTLEKLAFVEGAFLIEADIRLARGTCSTDQATRGFAVRVAGTRQEHAEAAPLDGHFLATIIAILDFHFAIVGGKFRRKILDEIAIGIAIAAQEETVSADALEQFTLAAFFASLSGGNAGFVRQHFVRRSI